MCKEDVVAGADPDLQVRDGRTDRLSAAFGTINYAPNISAYQKRAGAEPDEKLSAAAVTIIGDVLAELAMRNDSHEISSDLILLGASDCGASSPNGQ
jgi:hypothetical protein